MKRCALIIAIAFAIPAAAHADCVVGAKSKTQFQVLDSHTVMLTGGYGGSILIKTFAFFNSGSSVTVLKDSFCDYGSAVLYMDGETVDAQQVKNIN